MTARMTTPAVTPDNLDCLVLMSTYNGAAHLEAQLASIAAQERRPLRIVVRDDGSRDRTVDILKACAERGMLTVEEGENVGPCASFLDLLARHGSADVVLFADQDDVWQPDKVGRAVDALAAAEPDEPALYCARVELADEAMRPLGHSPLWPSPGAFGNALVENIAMGCTIAMNRAAVALVAQVPPPRAAIMHDWWCYLVVSAFGRVVYDPRPALKYRMHAGNAVGLPKSRLQWAWEKVSRQLAAPTLPRIRTQALEFQRLYADRLTPEQSDMIASLAAIDTVKGRLSFCAERRIHRQFASDDAALRVLVLLRGG